MANLYYVIFKNAPEIRKIKNVEFRLTYLIKQNSSDSLLIRKGFEILKSLLRQQTNTNELMNFVGSSFSFQLFRLLLQIGGFEPRTKNIQTAVKLNYRPLALGLTTWAQKSTHGFQ